MRTRFIKLSRLTLLSSFITSVMTSTLIASEKEEEFIKKKACRHEMVEAERLFKSDDDVEKRKGREVLLSLVSIKSEIGSGVAKFLFEFGDASDKEIGRQVLYDVVANPANYYHITGYCRAEEKLLFQLRIANTLIGGDEKDKRIAMEAVNKTYESARHSLIKFRSKQIPPQIEDPQRILWLMSYNANPLQSEALQALLQWGDGQYGRFARERQKDQLLNLAKAGQYNAVGQLLDLAKANEHNRIRLPDHESLQAYRVGYVAGLGAGASSPFQSFGQAYAVPPFGAYLAGYAEGRARDDYCPTYSDYYKAYLKGLQCIAQQVDHPKRYEAAKVLYDEKGDSSEVGKKALKEISQQANHPNQKEASHALGWGCSIM